MKRYDIDLISDGMEEQDNGNYVRYEDAAALAERLQLIAAFECICCRKREAEMCTACLAKDVLEYLDIKP